MEKPDWRKWSFAEKLNIRTAILLALNIEPDCPFLKCNKFDYHQWKECICKYLDLFNPEELSFLPNDTLSRRFEILADLAEHKFVTECEYDDIVEHYYYGDNVNACEFAEWAKPILEGMDLKLPEKFPAPKQLTNEDTNESIKSELSKSYKLIAILLDYICDNKSMNQSALVDSLIEKHNVRGLGKTNINTIFSNANKELKKE